MEGETASKIASRGKRPLPVVVTVAPGEAGWRLLLAHSASASPASHSRPRKRPRHTSAPPGAPTQPLRIPGAPVAGASGDMASNGSGNGSGVVAAAPTLPTGIAGVSVHRSQLVRLMLQQLADLGYDKAATALKEESGDHLEDDALLEFRASVLEGRWESAIGMVHELEFKSEAARTAAHVTLFRQQYLELLEAGQSWAALKVLRTSITPLLGRARVPTHAHTSAGNGNSGHGPSNGASTGTPNSTSNGTSNGTTDVPPSNGASNDTSDCGGARLGLGEGFGSLFASPHAATLGRRPRGDSNASDGAYSNLWSTSDSEDSDDGDDTDGALSLGAPSSPGDGDGEDDVTIVPSVATLAALALCQSPAQLRAHANWPGVHGGSRRDVLEAVQALLAPDVAVPPRRLLHLVGQAVAYQTQACLHHNTRSTLVSLMKDHRCSADVVPTRQACVLSDHGGEVWMVRFNRAGTRFATVGGDGAILVCLAMRGVCLRNPAPCLRCDYGCAVCASCVRPT